MQFRNAIFVITEESQCPLYNTGDEFTVDGVSLTFPAAKSTCLVLAQDVVGITSEDIAFERFEKGGRKKTRFECGGCTGIIRFEYKKDKGFATLQMKMLSLAEKKDKIKATDRFAEVLRTIDTFKTLSDDDLLDLSALLEVEDFAYGFPIVQKGEPGTRLFIIISGRVEVVDDKGVSLAEMATGEVFGEMSLLTGEDVSASILAAEPCKIATMSQKNFKHILQRFPALQVFFYKLLVRRITDINIQRAIELDSGMAGHISDIPPIELCQMINSIQKTGTLNFEIGIEVIWIKFYEGEVLDAQYNNVNGLDAFFDILTLRKGRFIFSQGLTASEMKKDILGGFMAIMMEGMKRIDDLSEQQ